MIQTMSCYDSRYDSNWFDMILYFRSFWVIVPDFFEGVFQLPWRIWSSWPPRRGIFVPSKSWMAEFIHANCTFCRCATMVKSIRININVYIYIYYISYKYIHYPCYIYIYTEYYLRPWYIIGHTLVLTCALPVYIVNDPLKPAWFPCGFVSSPRKPQRCQANLLEAFYRIAPSDPCRARRWGSTVQIASGDVKIAENRKIDEKRQW